MPDESDNVKYTLDKNGFYFHDSTAEAIVVDLSFNSLGYITNYNLPLFGTYKISYTGYPKEISGKKAFLNCDAKSSGTGINIRFVYNKINEGKDIKYFIEFNTAQQKTLIVKANTKQINSKTISGEEGGYYWSSIQLNWTEIDDNATISFDIV